jgi:hypothetical protein
MTGKRPLSGTHFRVPWRSKEPGGLRTVPIPGSVLDALRVHRQDGPAVGLVFGTR